MPIYEYICRNCKNLFEKLVSFKDLQGEFICPRCNSRDVERVMSVFASSLNKDRYTNSKSFCSSPSKKFS
jgi:putative FmdB family regulatory protein